MVTSRGEWVRIPQPGLCSFFEQVKAQFFPIYADNPITRATAALKELNAALETARRTKAPAQVPASRCAPDPKPEGRRSLRGKPRKRAKR